MVIINICAVNNIHFLALEIKKKCKLIFYKYYLINAVFQVKIETPDHSKPILEGKLPPSGCKKREKTSVMAGVT